MKLKVRQGNSHADYMDELMQISDRASEPILFWVENPDTSWLWRQKRYERFRAANSDNLFRCCFCRFGTPWRKGTRFATNLKALRGLRMMCRCRRGHLQLRGQSPHGRPWTQIAEPYPRPLCDLLGKAIALECGWITRKRLDIAGCSKTGSLRPGEAKSPGPRWARQPRTTRLEDIPLLTTSTLRRESVALASFITWAQAFFESIDVETLFQAVPEFLVSSLNMYGKREFATGGTLSSYRHLLLSCQMASCHTISDITMLGSHHQMGKS